MEMDLSWIVYAAIGIIILLTLIGSCNTCSR